MQKQSDLSDLSTGLLNFSNLQGDPENRAFTRLSLLRNQLCSTKQTSHPLEKEKGAKIIDENLIAIPLVIPFDKQGNPILTNTEHKKDYEMLKDLFCDPEVMKSTGFNFGMTLTKNQLHPIMSSCVRHSDDERSGHYGLYKIYDKSIGEYVGVQGMMPLADKNNNIIRTPATKATVLESLTLVDAKHLRQGYGSKLIDWSFADAEKRGDIVMYTVRIDNAGTKAICTKHMPVHLGLKNVGGKENYTGKVDVFITLKSLKKLKYEIINKIANEVGEQIKDSEIRELYKNRLQEFSAKLLGGQTSATQTNQVQKKQLSPSL